MPHFLGLEHSFGGLINQGLNVLGQISPSTSILSSLAQPTVGIGPLASGFVSAGPAPGFNSPINGGAVVNGDTCGARTTEIKEVVVDKITGAVICVRKKKSRKRRPRLATNSDIADLSALKAVLGPKMLGTWIATRGRK